MVDLWTSDRILEKHFNGEREKYIDRNYFRDEDHQVRVREKVEFLRMTLLRNSYLGKWKYHALVFG